MQILRGNHLHISTEEYNEFGPACSGVLKATVLAESGLGGTTKVKASKSARENYETQFADDTRVDTDESIKSTAGFFARPSCVSSCRGHPGARSPDQNLNQISRAPCRVQLDQVISAPAPLWERMESSGRQSARGQGHRAIYLSGRDQPRRLLSAQRAS